MVTPKTPTAARTNPDAAGSLGFCHAGMTLRGRGL